MQVLGVEVLSCTVTLGIRSVMTRLPALLFLHVLLVLSRSLACYTAGGLRGDPPTVTAGSVSVQPCQDARWLAPFLPWNPTQCVALYLCTPIRVLCVFVCVHTRFLLISRISMQCPSLQPSMHLSMPRGFLLL